MTISLGADPELFMVDRNQQPLPVCGLLGGTKDNPTPLGVRGYSVQEDNVMLEFNIPPARSPREFVRNMENATHMVSEFVGERMPDARFSTSSALLFPDSALQSKGAATFGCSPDFNAYDNGAAFRGLRREELVEDGGEWRFAGGHVHIGYDNMLGVPDFAVAAFADVFLGLHSVSIDKQGARRRYYGQPGRYRPTPYGIEYRTLSNFWISDHDTVYAVASQARNLASFIEKAGRPRLHRLFKSMPWGDVRAAISGENAAAADDLLAYLRTEGQLGELV